MVNHQQLTVYHQLNLLALVAKYLANFYTVFNPKFMDLKINFFDMLWIKTMGHYSHNTISGLWGIGSFALLEVLLEKLIDKACGWIYGNGTKLGNDATLLDFIK
jgi:hypothetical protein